MILVVIPHVTTGGKCQQNCVPNFERLVSLIESTLKSVAIDFHTKGSRKYLFA